MPTNYLLRIGFDLETSKLQVLVYVSRVMTYYCFFIIICFPYVKFREPGIRYACTL